MRKKIWNGVLRTGLLCVLCFMEITACAPVKNIQESQQVEVKAKRQQPEPQQERKLETAQISTISGGKYAYEQLNEEEKQVYDEILSAILEHRDKTNLSSTDVEVMRRAYTAVCGDYGGLFWVDGYVFTRYTRGEELVELEFSPNYTMTEEERREVQSQIDAVVEQWLGGISINDTEYEKAKYVYELLSSGTEYSEGAENSQNIISVFLNGRTVCQGYACAVQYLMQQLGVESVIVSGTALGDAHAWNLLRLDSQYYHMDVTWGKGKYTDEAGAEHTFVDYKYMTMTTEEMQRNHTPDGNLKLPECSSMADNYYKKEGNYVEQWDPERIGTMLSQSWREEGMLTLHFSSEELYRQTLSYFVEEGKIAEYCQGITEISYMPDDAWREISFCFMK